MFHSFAWGSSTKVRPPGAPGYTTLKKTKLIYNEIGHRGSTRRDHAAPLPEHCEARDNAIADSHAAAATKTTALLTALYYSYIIIAKAHVQHNTRDQWLLVDAS